MSKHESDETFLHEQISLRNEYTRFACMFYFFTLLAFFTSISLVILANNSSQHESESIQRRFIPYAVLGSISVILFFVFFLGSLVYTRKLIKNFRFNAQSTSSEIVNKSNSIDKLQPLQSLILSSTNSKSNVSFLPSKSRTTTHLSSSSTPCQTDV